MVNLVLTHNLKPGVDTEQFEEWVRTTDYPGMRGLSRVLSFSTYRIERLLIGNGDLPANYVEIFQIKDFESFVTEDMPGDIVESIMGEFMSYVDNPAFMVVSEIK
ncbi:hypothetical protein [Parasphingorhabdus sp.]|uniref:hypothetical protein n=1 Tax=Parasphingorhabdus sp. TaxID=2709688 RepID=UPI003593F766